MSEENLPFNPADFGIRGSKLRAMQSMSNKEKQSNAVAKVTSKSVKRKKMIHDAVEPVVKDAENVVDESAPANGSEVKPEPKKSTIKKRSGLHKRKREDKKKSKGEEKKPKKKAKLEKFTYIQKSNHLLFDN